jgi:inhibitor of Bruton tyrosine kinase
LNRLLDELDEDILVELGEAVRANQLAYLPISKSEDAEARLFEEHPDLTGKVERDRKVKIDYMMLRSHLIEDEAKLAKLERSSARRITSSAGDLMFDMDEDNVEPGMQKHGSHWSLGSRIAGDQDDVIASPPSSLPAEGIWSGKADSAATGSLTMGSLVAAVTPPGHRTLEPATPAATTEQAQGGLSPWIAPSFQTSKLNMKEIMAQASEGKESNISVAFAVASSPSTQVRSSHFGKLSQKERKRQLQAQKEAAAKPAEAAISPSTGPARPSPWHITSIRPSVSIQEETANAGPSRSTDQRRASGTPPLTMRQTIPGNMAAARKSSAISTGSGSHIDTQRRSVSSPVVHQTSPNAHHTPAKPQPRPSPAPNVPTTPSKSSPIIPKSIRHIPPAPTLEPSSQSSMADILTQQQTEKSAQRAATTKRSLQEIQEEQAFQEWWDQEEAATKARMEQEAAAAAAAEAKVKGAASGRGRARGRGASGQSGRGRGRRGSAAADESAAVEGGSRGKGAGAGADSGRSAGDKGRGGRNATRAARRASGKKPSPAATAES